MLRYGFDTETNICLIFSSYLIHLFNREREDGLCEVTFTFHRFDDRLLQFNRAVPYKYVVHSPRNEAEDDCYEYLHEHPGADCNRCLMIPRDQLKTLIGGIYITTVCFTIL